MGLSSSKLWANDLWANKEHQTIYCWALRRYLNELIQQALLNVYVLTLEIIFRHLNMQPPREQNLISQYKTID